MSKIMIIEDDEAIRNSTREFLIDSGYDVSVATNGQDAMDQLHSTEQLPDLILLDLMMPVKDGFEFRREQQRDPLIKSIPVIIMSADGHTQAKQLQTEAIDYLKKPFDVSAMLEKIGKHLH